MPGGTIWKGHIHFDGTDLPVKLHSVVKEERIQFHLLHESDHAKLRQQMVCAYDKKPVPAEEQVKGFEVEDGKYILVDPDELEKAEPESSRIIEVREFVKTDQIGPIFLEHTYYLEPDTHSKGYNALAAVLKEMDAVGICTWAMRKRAYFGALQARGKTLRLNTLRHADEVVAAGSLELEKFPLSEKELAVGSELINHLTAPFQPQKFENEHQKKLQKLIDKKARGEKIRVLRPKHLKPTEPNELLRVLEESLKKAA